MHGLLLLAPSPRNGNILIVGLTVLEFQLQVEEGREGRRAGCCCCLLPCAQHIFLHGFPAAVIDDHISSNVP